jgi:hypothetical protein
MASRDLDIRTILFTREQRVKYYFLLAKVEDNLFDAVSPRVFSSP